MIALLLACVSPTPSAEATGPAMVEYRPGDPLPTLGPQARIDRGLRAAAEELAAGATSPDARPSPKAVRGALARAGYPGEAQFVRVRGGADLPKEILDILPRDRPVDVGWAWRDFADGTRWWVVGWATRYVELDPLPRDPVPGRAFPMRVDGPAGLRLLIGRPDGKVQELSFDANETRWLKLEGGQGEYRVEVVGNDKVALLFSLFYGVQPEPAGTLPGPVPIQDPRAATQELYGRLDTLRAQVGLPRLVHFDSFEEAARTHAACLAATGSFGHATDKCQGVPAATAITHAPRARFHEDLAIAANADEAWDLLMASPGHRQNLLCPTCTHVAVGAALEPAMPPRLFVAWELMDFPDGEPVALRRSW